MESFDVVVIGTGEAGATVAQRLAAKGKRVAIVDHRPYGGTCALRGCDPKKVLISAARVVALSEQLQHRGIAALAQITWSELMASRQKFTEPVPLDREKSFQKAGITTFHGHASFVNEQSLQVGDTLLSADHFIIAIGAKPRKAWDYR
jgi:glutathione reductase (NADPH)